MVRQTEPEDLAAAWRALTGDSLNEGWRTISVGVTTRCQIRAGRHFPGNEEAVLVGLALVAPPIPSSLPAGAGFVVKTVDLSSDSEGCVWFGLVRQPAGRLDFFAMMAADVISTIIATEPAEDDDRLLVAFLGRVRAWQSFMERDREGILSPEAEVGLHGELLVLHDMISSGVSPELAIMAWYGPLDGLQDFVFPTGSIEVKATISVGTFPAVISSLEQLDDTTLPSLFLAGVRLRVHPTGLNLPRRTEVLRDLLKDDPSALASFENRLLHAGYFPALADRYPRTFVHDITKLWQVSGAFPRLTHATVPAAVRRARYEVDLELVAATDVPLHDVLTITGAY
ncbi:MAG: hypothetical protein A2075_02790 [Geobacteraceae bacterium GWC2_58_44]|nr:MAG: hypothetical protein A2075_02790 [Geobacteraceae bacterium GWC2_58_44]HBG05155.1 PD-(D/E)XK motif protein [Geobacter sp.]